MIVDPYLPNVMIGDKYRQYILAAKKNMQVKDDDFVLVIVGGTGVGKSNLGLWTQMLVVETPLIEQIALTREDFSKSLKEQSVTSMGERYLQYDEGKLNRRDWTSSWSKELLEIYHDIRGLRIFHVWCTAMPNLLDREFVKERVNALVYCYDKSVGKPRNFLLFLKNDLLKFLQQNDTLSMPTLKRFGKQHATMQSWFREYKGPMKQAYLQKKDARMVERVEAFYKKWGSGNMTTSEVAREFNIDPKTVRTWMSAEEFVEGTHYFITGSGIKTILPEGRLLIKEISETKREKGIMAYPSSVPSLVSRQLIRRAKKNPVNQKRSREAIILDKEDQKYRGFESQGINEGA